MRPRFRLEQLSRWGSVFQAGKAWGEAGSRAETQEHACHGSDKLKTPVDLTGGDRQVLMVVAHRRGTSENHTSSQTWSRRPPQRERREPRAPQREDVRGEQVQAAGAPSTEGGEPGREISRWHREQRVSGRGRHHRDGGGAASAWVSEHSSRCFLRVTFRSGIVGRKGSPFLKPNFPPNKLNPLTP